MLFSQFPVHPSGEFTDTKRRFQGASKQNFHVSIHKAWENGEPFIQYHQ